MRSGRAAVLLALLVAGCGPRAERDLERENTLLRAQLAEAEARLRDCARSAHAMIDVQDTVGSGSGIDLDEDNDDSQDNVLGADQTEDGPIDQDPLASDFSKTKPIKRHKD